MDLESMGMDEFNALTEEQQLALLEAAENPQGVPAQPAEMPAAELSAEVPQGAPAPQPSAEEQIVQQEQQRRGDPEVPLRQLREQVRQQEEALRQRDVQLQQMQQMMAQFMGQGQQQHQPQVPELAMEDPEAINYMVANHPVVQQLQQTNRQMQEMLQRAQHEARMAELRRPEMFGPEADQMLADFDANVPHMAELDPEAKLLIMLGARSKNPQYQQQQQALTQQAAQQLAVQQVEQVLANPGKRIPQTLSNVPPAASPEMEIDINNLTQADFDKLTPEQMKKIEARF